MRRLTRLTNGFSKKVENHALAVALFTTYYNFVRIINKTLRVTPAMAAGVTDKLWEIGDMVKVLEAWEECYRLLRQASYSLLLDHIGANLAPMHGLFLESRALFRVCRFSR
jgi:hypothetical protein